MEKNELDILNQIDTPDFDPDQMGCRFWYEQYLQQREENRQLRTQLSQVQGEVEQLKEALRKLTKGAKRKKRWIRQPLSDSHQARPLLIVWHRAWRSKSGYRRSPIAQMPNNNDPAEEFRRVPATRIFHSPSDAS